MRIFLFCALIFLVFAGLDISCSKKPEQQPIEPVAKFAWSFEGGRAYTPAIVQFNTEGSTADSYEWTCGNAGNHCPSGLSGSRPRVTFEHAGEYIISLVSVKGNKRSETFRDTIVVAPDDNPVASFQVPTDIKATVAATFTNTSVNADTWEWSVDNNATIANAAEKDAIVTFPSSGTDLYHLTLKAKKQGKTDATRTVAISVGPAPVAVVANFDFPTVAGTDTVVTFRNTSTGAESYVWKVNETDNVSTQSDLQYTFLTGGTFRVTLTATRGAVSATITKEITVTLTPIEVDFTVEPLDLRLQPFDRRIRLLSSNATSYELNLIDGNGSIPWTGADTSVMLLPKQEAAGAGTNYDVKLIARRSLRSQEIVKSVRIRDTTMLKYYPVTAGTFAAGVELSNVSGFGGVYGAIPTTGVILAPDKENTADEAINFTGDSYVKLPANFLRDELLTPSTHEITISFFFKLDRIDEKQVLLASQDTDGSAISHPQTETFIYYEPQNNLLKARWPMTTMPADTYLTAGGTNWNARTWHHVILVVTDSKQTLYLDGQRISSLDVAPNGVLERDTNKFAYTHFGHGVRMITDISQNWYFRGQMDNIRFFNRRLLLPEIVGLSREK